MAAPSHPRPLSPHLQIWRWHATMAASIFHRASGMALYASALALVAWLVALAAGRAAYAPIEAAFHSVYGQLALYGAFAALAYHAANGVRHLIWDSGRRLDPKRAEASAWLVIAIALAAPAALYVYLNFGGRP